MKAVVFTRYGELDALQLQEVAQPSITADQVLVRVHAASVNANIGFMVSGKPWIARLMTGGLTRPKYRIPGNDIAGVVEAVGSGVTAFRPGDAVYGDLAEHGYGAFAEYVAAPATALRPMPAGSSFADAAAVPEAALVALQGLRERGQLKAGERVLIVGASGGIGTFAVQIARHLGGDVTAVCSSRNAELMQSLGAQRVIDYTREDFLGGGQTYDLILAIKGYRPIGEFRRALKPGGRYVVAGGEMKQIFAALLRGPLLSQGGRKLSALTVKPNQDLEYVTGLIEAGIVRPVIDRCYPMSEAVEALRYYATGRSRGKVIVTIGADRA